MVATYIASYKLHERYAYMSTYLYTDTLSKSHILQLHKCNVDEK